MVVLFQQNPFPQASPEERGFCLWIQPASGSLIISQIHFDGAQRIEPCAKIQSNMETFAKETDGFFARHFDRKISGAISRRLIQTPVTPNQITVGVTLIGIFSGVLMAQKGATCKIAGALVFLLTSILDGCDGEVARAKKMTSRLGGWLDLWGDNVIHIAVFYGLGLGLAKDLGNPVYVALGQIAAVGTLIAASLASYQTYMAGRSSFTSVSGDASRFSQNKWTGKLTRLSDVLARRDFIYGVVVLALVNRLQWFLWACSIGVVMYAFVLLVLFFLTLPAKRRAE
jgi:phosphatidylglycerophosphate synthase